MKSFGTYCTLSQQLNYNLNAYCLDYTRYTIIYYASHATSGRKHKVSKEVWELANAFRENKPTTMVEMTALENKLGLRLYHTNEKPTPVSKGTAIVYIEPAGKDRSGVDQVGHAYLVKNGNKYHVESKPNDCFYAVCGMILETNGNAKSVDQLRRMTAEAIESNENFKKVLEAEKWIRNSYPQEANTLLFCAGIKQNNGILEVEEADLKNLIDQIDENDDANQRGGTYCKIFKV